MSRCFPFPPPGYEKKIPTTHSDILKKDKHREKKHKKEKKDKEKKDKDKEKKEKKEKRRDKKKEREKDKSQQSDNLNTSAETRHKVQPQEHNELNVIQKNLETHTPDEPTVSGRTVGYNGAYHSHYTPLFEEPNGTKFVPSAGRTVRDDAERGGSHMICEKIIPIPHRRNEGGATFYNNIHLDNDFEDSNLALELDRRLKNEAEQPYDQSQTANKLISANLKRDGGVIKSVSSHIRESDYKGNAGSNGRHVGDKFAEAKLVPRISGLGQGNLDRMPRPTLDSDIAKKIEGQIRINHQEDFLEQRGKKRKDEERNGDRKSHEKHKNREKEWKKDKANNRVDQNASEMSTRESLEMDISCIPNKEMLHGRENNISSTSIDEKTNLAKSLLANGISRVTGPSLLSRPLHNENGRAPEPYQMLVNPSPGEQVATGDIKMDNVGKINGIIAIHEQRPATEQVVRARPRSPHPDAKRFIDILAIPKIAELSEIEDSDWLISTTDGPDKKLKVDDSRNTMTADTPQVWSKATTIESADVCALPYIIPY